MGNMMKKIKKLLSIGLAALLTLGMSTGCNVFENISNLTQLNDTNNYKVTTDLDDWLHSRLKKYYKAGETVVVKINIAHDVGFSLYMNGEKLQRDSWKSGQDYWQYTFTMPEEDVLLTYKLSDGMQMRPIIEQVEYYDSVVYRFDSSLLPQYGILYINGIEMDEYSLAFEEMHFIGVTDISEFEECLIRYTMDIICIDTVISIELVSPTTFWIQGMGKMFKITNEFNFSQIFDDYSTNDSNDSNDIFYAACYPQDFEYNGRHYRSVQGVGLKTTVTQEELGELLGYIIREEDVSAFIQEYPNVDYVIDNGIYDYATNNRVAFYSVKAYPDLSFICMNQLGDYVLFQDITDLLD